MKTRNETINHHVYDTVLFDLDGTLFDSAPGVKSSLVHCFNKFSMSYTPEILHAMIGPPFRVSLKQFFGISPDDAERYIAAYREYYAEKGWYDCKPFEGVEDLLIKLKKAGKKLAVSTSKPIFFTDKILELYGFDKYFDFVGGALNDCSRDSKTAVIDHVLENLSVTDKNKAVIVGDRLYDIVGARESGIDSIAILWGYGNRAEFEEYNATYILETPDEVFTFLT